MFQPLDRCVKERKTVLIPTKCQPTAVIQLKVDKQEEVEDLVFPEYEPQVDIFLSLVHVALKVRSDMLQTLGHKGFSVNDDDAIACVPDSL